MSCVQPKQSVSNSEGNADSQSIRKPSYFQVNLRSKIKVFKHKTSTDYNAEPKFWVSLIAVCLLCLKTLKISIELIECDEYCSTKCWQINSPLKEILLKSYVLQ